jgi:hypothetical protein
VHDTAPGLCASDTAHDIAGGKGNASFRIWEDPPRPWRAGVSVYDLGSAQK